MAGPIKIPVGPARGKTITECTVAELDAACDDLDARVCAAGAAASSRRHRRFLGIARPLLKLRKFPVGQYAATEAANRALRDAATVGHLLAPSSQLAKVLEGCSLLVTAFRADVDAETFPSDDEPGRRVPAKAMLDRVANALGVRWVQCQRTDSENSPYIRSFNAKGQIREFDSSWRDIEANAEIDLNRGSPLHALILARKGDRGPIEIDRRRQHIASLCDTAARLRAIRGLGVQGTYSLAELEKPFFVAKLVFHGESENAGTKAIFDKAIAESFTGSSAALFPKRAVGDR